MRVLIEDHRSFWVVVSLMILLFATANLPWQLDNYDQAKQAFTSFEMVKEGHWLYQHTPHGRVATKPPLVGWISAALFAVTRSWNLAWRLPSFLPAIATALLLFGAGTAANGKIAGLIALSAFAFNLLSPRLATLVRTDMPLAFVVFLIGLLIWEKIRKQTGWTPRDRVHLFALLTAAMLIKGPIVYAFLLPGIVLFQWRGRARPAVAPERKSAGAWSGWWPWTASLAIFLLWVIGGILSQPGFFDEVVMREFLARFGETIHRPQPLYFYLAHLLHKFAPWSLLMIALAIVDLHPKNWRLGVVFREMSAGTFWLLCWSIGGLIVMSLIPSKRVDRIFPVIPPLCLLLAAQVSSRVGALRRPDAPAGRPYLSTTAALILAILFSSGYTTWKAITGYRDHRDALAAFGRNVRRAAKTHHWHYKVVFAKDEGLLLYLRKTHFILTNRAIAEWNRGILDALVVSTEKAKALMSQLHDANLRSNESGGERGSDYVLITR